jgi:hypothetical protein
MMGIHRHIQTLLEKSNSFFQNWHEEGGGVKGTGKMFIP